MMNKKTASLLCTAAMLVSAATGCTAEGRSRFRACKRRSNGCRCRSKHENS